MCGLNQRVVECPFKQHDQSKRVHQADGFKRWDDVGESADRLDRRIHLLDIEEEAECAEDKEQQGLGVLT